MRPDATRRSALLGVAAVAVGTPLSALAAERGDRGLAALEARSGGRLGVYARCGRHVLQHRADERFPMCSSFKFLLAARILSDADRGLTDLNEAVLIPRSALLSHAPVTQPAAEAGRPLSVEALCAAVVTVSDNTAANLLLARVAGPAGLTRWLRAYDPKTRLDRLEPELNESRNGDPRDTTTPEWMARDIETFMTGDALSKNARAKLLRWMTDCTTGLNKLRAGAPAGWAVADKTGNNGVHTSGDVALLTRPDGARVFVAAYVTQSTLRGAAQEAIFADVARLVTAKFARG
ncbi:class A beta-lactamase BOR-1 [soil metagenome]